MHRFYLANIFVSQNKIIINEKDAIHHIKNVLRLKEKDRICIFDGKGLELIGSMGSLSAQNMFIAIEEKLTAKDFDVNITVACAIPKRAKMDDIVDKLTQLGVDRIIPLDTERVVIKLDKQKKISRQLRWNKIALSASQQSQRSTIPVIEPIKDIKEVLSRFQGYDLKLIPTLIDERKSLKEIVETSKPKNILVLIGPEGDFTEEEVGMAKKAGFIPVTLGNLVLRVETAAVAVASFIVISLRK